MLYLKNQHIYKKFYPELNGKSCFSSRRENTLAWESPATACKWICA